MLNFLPIQLKKIILSSLDVIYEVRVRTTGVITIYGSCSGIKSKKSVNYNLTKKDIEKIVFALSDFSIYSKEESLKNGVIISNEGERVGVCGEIVYNNKDVITLKNFTSLCIRIPYDVKGCSKSYTSNLSAAKNCLVVSPPFHGKTTFIRDLGREYSDKFDLNVLFVDERDELSCGNYHYLGKNADVIRYANKDFGFTNGIRSYNPEVIVCDELISASDLLSLEFARLSGIIVIASAHSDSLKNLLKKQNLSGILKNNIFDDVIILNNFKIKKIYGEKDWLNLL